MSLFIGSLAFEQSRAIGTGFQDRLGILAGSLISAIGGVVVLRHLRVKRSHLTDPPASSRQRSDSGADD